MTSANIVNQSFQSIAITPIVRSLAADTSLVAFNVKVATGAQVPRGPSNPPKIYFATTSFSISAPNGPATLSRQAGVQEIPIPLAANATVAIQTEPALVLGGNLHVWSDAPAFDSAVTLEIDVVEV